MSRYLAPAVIVALAAGPFAPARDLAGLASGGYESAGGGRLHIQLSAAGGRLEISATDFYQEVREIPGGRQQVRTLFPMQLQIRAVGTQAASFSAIPVDYGDGWFAKTRVEAKLDQQTNLSIEPESIDLGDFGAEAGIPAETLERLKKTEQLRRVATLCPLTIRIVEEEESEPAIEIRLSPLPASSPAGMTVEHLPNSKITETRSTTSPSSPKDAEPKTTARTSDYRVPLSLRIGGAAGDGQPTHSNLLPPRLVFEDSEIRLVNALTDRRIVAAGGATQTSVAKISPDTKDGFPDTEMKVSWRLAIGETPDVAWMESNDSKPEAWMPVFGEKRRFAVHLKDPARVEGVRFLLEQVSRHPGVAINAGAARFAEGARAGMVQGVPVKLSSGQTDLRWNRSYSTYEPGPEDSAPDLHFNQRQNTGFHLHGEVRSEGLPNPVADGVVVKEVANPTVATVSVRDWAASGVIVAEVLVDGFWEPVEARGPGRTHEGYALKFPLDENDNAIADAFELGSRGDEDDDALDWFEEYRGGYVGGKHLRFNARRKDYFLLDYAGLLSNPTEISLDRRFNPHWIDLHFISPSEHSKETVGASAAVYVLESLRQNALPAILRIANAKTQIEAWRAIRPHPGSTSLFLDRPATGKAHRRRFDAAVGRFSRRSVTRPRKPAFFARDPVFSPPPRRFAHFSPAKVRSARRKSLAGRF